MFIKSSKDGFQEVLRGVRYRTLAFGEKTLMAEFRMDQGSKIPVRQHRHEQTGYLVSGHLKFVIGGRQHEAKPGDSWCIRSHVEHGVEVLADSVVVEVFSPPREDYLPT